MRCFTIVGTDTGVGKTFVTAALIAAARSTGAVAFGLKPIESGVSESTKSDTALLAYASDRGEIDTNLLQLAPAIAPGLISANNIEIRAIAAFIEDQCAKTKVQAGSGPGGNAVVCFVETAGGWFSPLTACGDVRELAATIAAPVIIVGPATLGAINQTRLTIAAVRAANLPIAAVVLSQRPADDAVLAAQNAEAIAHRTGQLTQRLCEATDATRIIGLMRNDAKWGW